MNKSDIDLFLNSKSLFSRKVDTSISGELIQGIDENVFIFGIWERKRLDALYQSSGLQSNGTDAYTKYKDVDNKILYFDTRIKKQHRIEEDSLAERLKQLSKNKPLPLAFSGRSIKIKGADHLLQLANKLKRQNIHFIFNLYGSGDLEYEMKEYITHHNLSDCFFMTGAIDFYKELFPKIKNETDLFVCLHRQGDPCCTHIETMSCGVPIVGYNNNAFTGILERADIGWDQKPSHLDGIVDVIKYLDKNRNEIVKKAKACLEFATNHDFETVF